MMAAAAAAAALPRRDDPRDARKIEVNRSELMDVWARQLLTQEMTELLFGTPKSQQGVTLRASDLVAVTTEITFEAEAVFLQGLASMGLTPQLHPKLAQHRASRRCLRLPTSRRSPTPSRTRGSLARAPRAPSTSSRGSGSAWQSR
jgi:hypothetical protein